MGIEENKKILQRYFDEVLNGRDYTNIDELMHDDFNGAGGSDITGKQAHIQFFKQYYSFFPDARCEIEKMIGEGDSVVAIGAWSGTFSGMGDANHFAKGKQMKTPMISHYEFKDGKLMKGTVSRDAVVLYQQLGYLPSDEEIMKATSMLRDPNTYK